MYQDNIFHSRIEDDEVETNDPADLINADIRKKVYELTMNNSTIQGDLLSRLKIIVPTEEFPNLDTESTLRQNLSLSVETVGNEFHIHPSYSKDISSEEFSFIINNLIDLFGGYVREALNKFR